MERYQQAARASSPSTTPPTCAANYPWWDDIIGALMPGHAATALPRPARHGQASRTRAPVDGGPAATRWERTEEWYNFDATRAATCTCWSPRTRRPTTRAATRWATTTRSPGAARTRAAGCGPPRWATGAAYSETDFRSTSSAASKWAAGNAPGDCGGTAGSNFEKVTLDTNTVEPMALDVAPDGRVFYTEPCAARSASSSPQTQTDRDRRHARRLHRRRGRPDRHGPGPELRHQRLGLPLLLARAGSPTDDQPALPVHGRPATRSTSRREKVMLEVPACRGRTPSPGTPAAYIDVRPATATSTSAPATTSTRLEPSGGLRAAGLAAGHVPLRRRAHRRPTPTTCAASCCASSPEPTAGYTIPAGNLFPPGTAQTRPEIYAMGFRNPFRFSVDPQTGWIYLADYGPDPAPPTTNRGPEGLVELNVIKRPGQLRLAVLHRRQPALRAFNSATNPVVGAKFNCATPVNNSPNNTGLTSLPPSSAAEIWYGYGVSPIPGDARRRRARRRWAARSTTTTRQLDVGHEVPAVLRRHAVLLRVAPQLHQGDDRSTATGNAR